MLKYAFIAAALLVANIESILGECWDTGCQLDSWAVKGCSQYKMVETGRRSCQGGKIYSCCSGGGGAPAPGPAPAPAPSGGNKYGDATYYNLGMTACGQVYQDTDLVAAIAFKYFTTANPNLDPICGRKVRVTDPSSGRSVVVAIRDKCGGCKEQDIDLSPTAFQQLRALGAGRFKVNWNFI